MSISQLIFTQKTHKKGSTGKLYLYSTKWEKSIVIILHIYGDRSIFLLFNDYQDTLSTEWNINDNFSTNIHQLKYTKGYMGQWYSHSTKWDKYTVVIIHIYGARAIILLFNDDQDTEKEWR